MESTTLMSREQVAHPALRRVRDRAQDLAAALVVASYRTPAHVTTALDALIEALEEAARG